MNIDAPFMRNMVRRAISKLTRLLTFILSLVVGREMLSTAEYYRRHHRYTERRSKSLTG